MSKEPHLRAVPNPDSNKYSETRELVKTVALTTIVSSLVGVFALAGGQAVINAFRRRSKKKAEAELPQAAAAAMGGGVGATVPPHVHTQPSYDDASYEDQIPASLRMEPRLRSTGGRRGGSQADLDRMFKSFEKRLDKRFQTLADKIEDLEEDDD